MLGQQSQADHPAELLQDILGLFFADGETFDLPYLGGHEDLHGSVYQNVYNRERLNGKPCTYCCGEKNHSFHTCSLCQTRVILLTQLGFKSSSKLIGPSHLISALPGRFFRPHKQVGVSSFVGNPEEDALDNLSPLSTFYLLQRYPGSLNTLREKKSWYFRDLLPG